MSEHVHKRIYLADNALVCDECVTDEQIGKNECFCSCHANSQLICQRCKIYHQA